jgi:predicted chitinase
MYKKLIIEESDKSHIKKLYGLKEQAVSNTFLLDFIKKGFDSLKTSDKSPFSDDSDKSSFSDTTKGLTDDSDTEISSLDDTDIKLTGNFNSEQKNIIKLTIDEMKKQGITNPYAQIGILSVIDKESRFKTYKEIGYGNTSDFRIESIFGNRGRRCKHLKKNDAKFFDCVYGYQSGMKLGNDEPGDGWKYIGRGLNGITGKANYRKYGNMIGVDLVNNPELLENPRIAAKVAIAYFTKGKSGGSIPNFRRKEDAVNYFADLNAGRANSTFGRSKAMASSSNFEINTSDLS